MNNLVSISRDCLKKSPSEPCSHMCIFKNDDFTTRIVSLRSETIVKFWDQLTVSEKEHFKSFKEKLKMETIRM